jgi:hypothetical protein
LIRRSTFDFCLLPFDFSMRIGRYDNPLKCVTHAGIDPAVRQEPVGLEAADGGLSSGILYTTSRKHRTVVCFLHPRADMSRHYAIPALVRAGYACFGQNSRWLNNDETCVHEQLLLDVAAGLRFLRSHGFEYIVLLGNSGGGSLYAFYLAQATTPPPGRLTHTAAGDPFDLNRHVLPIADGLLLLAAHLGEGRILMDMLDPSVTDENDPLSCDLTLDPYNPLNGYREPPEASRYDPAFIERYRAAQRERVARLDAIARAHLERKRQARAALAAPDFPRHRWTEQARAQRTAALGVFMIVHRTEADLRALDLTLDPSERDAGTLFSYRPDLTNYMEFGFARICTPRAWLSTWSALSTNADLLRNAAKVTVPSFVIYYRGDNAIFPSDARIAYEALGASDKQLASAPGDHYGFGVGTQHRTGAPEALAQIVAWLRERFRPE